MDFRETCVRELRARARYALYRYFACVRVHGRRSIRLKEFCNQRADIGRIL